MVSVESIKIPSIKKLSIDQLIDLAKMSNSLISDITKIIITKQLIKFTENHADQEFYIINGYEATINNFSYKINGVFDNLYSSNNLEYLLLQFNKFKINYIKNQNINKNLLDRLLFTAFYGDIYIEEHFSRQRR